MGKSRLLFWLGVALVVLIKMLIVPMIPTLTVANFMAHYLPARLAPLNWFLGLALLAVCQGPVLMPRYFSIPLNVLCVVSVLFFLGSWNLHPLASPIVGFFAFMELNWMIPLWEAKRVPQTEPIRGNPIQ